MTLDLHAAQTTRDNSPPSVPADELDDVLQGLRAFIRAEVVPRHDAIREATSDRVRMFDPDGRYTPQVLAAIQGVRSASASAGYYTMLAPTSVGGSGLGYEALFRVWEAIYEVCGAEYWLGHHTVSHWSRGPCALLAQLPEAVRSEVLPPLLAGSQTLCFAMSEPDAGSDIWRMQTKATRADPSGWVLSGTKQWITNGPYATHAIVFAVTDSGALHRREGGITALLVPTSAPGVDVARILEMFGHPGGDEATLTFDGVFVPDDYLIGEVNAGLPAAMAMVSTGRLYNSARAVGMAQWALVRALRYAEERFAFGRAIIENQGVSFPLAESAMDVHAARLLGLDCAKRLDHGLPVRKELAIAKAFATEAAVRVIDRAMQIHGASGFTNELSLSEAWQQARRVCVADGTAEMMRLQIIKQLRREQRMSAVSL